MARWSRLGRIIFAGAAAGLGAEHLLIRDFPRGLEPVPEWVPGRLLLAVAYGLLLLIGGFGVVVGFRPRVTSRIIAAAFLVMTMGLEIPLLLSNIAAGSNWTRTFESLAMVGAAFALVATFAHGSVPGWVARGGRRLFAAGLLAFGALHFLYLQFTGTLVPAWIPFRVVWAGFVGACFIAAGLALLTGIRSRLAGIWTGVMFAGFIGLMHLPAVIASPMNPGQWANLLVALLMCGGAWVVAGLSAP